MKLDDKYLLHGAHRRLIYELRDKYWIPHIGINKPFNCKQTHKKEYQEKLFFDWKIILENV